MATLSQGSFIQKCKALRSIGWAQGWAMGSFWWISIWWLDSNTFHNFTWGLSMLLVYSMVQFSAWKRFMSETTAPHTCSGEASHLGGVAASCFLTSLAMHGYLSKSLHEVSPCHGCKFLTGFARTSEASQASMIAASTWRPICGLRPMTYLWNRKIQHIVQIQTRKKISQQDHEKRGLKPTQMPSDAKTNGGAPETF